MKTTLKGKDFIETLDWSKEELETVLDAAKRMKLECATDKNREILKNKNLFMMFFEHSLQTCNSIKSAMDQLGGHAHYFSPNKMELAHGQTPKDTGMILSRYGNAIAIKNCCYGAGNRYIKEVAHFARVPVINLQCDMDHPCQTIADMMSIREKFGTNLKGVKFALSWAYSQNYSRAPSLPQGLISLMPRFGLDMVLACPKEYKLMPKSIETAQKLAKENGTSFEITDNMDYAMKDADIVYPYFWGCQEYLCQKGVLECDRPKICNDILKNYKHWICDSSKIKLAKKNAVYMHPLPADRGHEVEDAVIDGEQSIVYDQAENRLHTIKAICALTIN
jgi:N-acetylornithine carbamoyltransferase